MSNLFTSPNNVAYFNNVISPDNEVISKKAFSGGARRVQPGSTPSTPQVKKIKEEVRKDKERDSHKEISYLKPTESSKNLQKEIKTPSRSTSVRTSSRGSSSSSNVTHTIFFTPDRKTNCSTFTSPSSPNSSIPNPSPSLTVRQLPQPPSSFLSPSRQSQSSQTLTPSFITPKRENLEGSSSTFKTPTKTPNSKVISINTPKNNLSKNTSLTPSRRPATPSNSQNYPSTPPTVVKKRPPVNSTPPSASILSLNKAAKRNVMNQHKTPSKTPLKSNSSIQSTKLNQLSQSTSHSTISINSNSISSPFSSTLSRLATPKVIVAKTIPKKSMTPNYNLNKISSPNSPVSNPLIYSNEIITTMIPSTILNGKNRKDERNEKKMDLFNNNSNIGNEFAVMYESLSNDEDFVDRLSLIRDDHQLDYENDSDIYLHDYENSNEIDNDLFNNGYESSNIERALFYDDKDEEDATEREQIEREKEREVENDRNLSQIIENINKDKMLTNSLTNLNISSISSHTSSSPLTTPNFFSDIRGFSPINVSSRSDSPFFSSSDSDIKHPTPLRIANCTSSFSNPISSSQTTGNGIYMNNVSIQQGLFQSTVSPVGRPYSNKFHQSSFVAIPSLRRSISTGGAETLLALSNKPSFTTSSIHFSSIPSELSDNSWIQECFNITEALDSNVCKSSRLNSDTTNLISPIPFGSDVEMLTDLPSMASSINSPSSTSVPSELNTAMIQDSEDSSLLSTTSQSIISHVPLSNNNNQLSVILDDNKENISPLFNPESKSNSTLSPFSPNSSPAFTTCISPIPLQNCSSHPSFSSLSSISQSPVQSNRLKKKDRTPLSELSIPFMPSVDVYSSIEYEECETPLTLDRAFLDLTSPNYKCSSTLAITSPPKYNPVQISSLTYSPSSVNNSLSFNNENEQEEEEKYYRDSVDKLNNVDFSFHDNLNDYPTTVLSDSFKPPQDLDSSVVLPTSSSIAVRSISVPMLVTNPCDKNRKTFEDIEKNLSSTTTSTSEEKSLVKYNLQNEDEDFGYIRNNSRIFYDSQNVSSSNSNGYQDPIAKQLLSSEAELELDQEKSSSFVDYSSSSASPLISDDSYNEHVRDLNTIPSPIPHAIKPTRFKSLSNQFI